MSESEKVALITGGARRVGRAVSLSLHRAGWRVVVHCNTSIDEANQLTLQMNRLREDSASVVLGNLCENVSLSAQSIVEKSVNKWGRLDLVVNNASNFISNTLNDVTEAQWDASMNVNLKAPVFIMQAASKYLKEKRGSIINMADMIGIKPKDTHFQHTVSKAALISATLTAALTLAPEVRVNAIAPGCVLWPEVDPEMFDESEKQKWLDQTPLHKLGTPEDVAETVLFLSSPGSNFITGQVISLDGGRGLVF